MFVSSQDSQELGWSVASAMSIHNLTEGFMIALPLYFALQSRSEAFCWAALLGGLSQPLGALMGLLLIENIDQTQEDVVFGVTFGLVSGMMSLITVQVGEKLCELYIFAYTDPLCNYSEHAPTSDTGRQGISLRASVLFPWHIPRFPHIHP